MDTKQINQNDRIKVVTGEWLTVMMVYDNMIYVYEHQNVIHASKILAVKHE